MSRKITVNSKGTNTKKTDQNMYQKKIRGGQNIFDIKGGGGAWGVSEGMSGGIVGEFSSFSVHFLILKCKICLSVFDHFVGLAPKGFRLQFKMP